VTGFEKTTFIVPPVRNSRVSMNYKEFASELPHLRTIVFSSAEENEETMQRLGVNQIVRQLGRGTFRSDLALRSTEHADFFSDRFSKAISISLEPPAGTVGILFPLSASGHFLACGNEVASDKLLVQADGSGTDIVAPDLAGSEAIAITEARFIEMAETLCPTANSLRPGRMTVVDGDTTQLRALRDGVLYLTAHPELEPSDEQVSNLLAAVVAWIGHSSSHWRPEGFSVNGAGMRVAKRAQEFIEENYREAIRIVDVCRVTGVGVRTLQRCFREYFDLTITDYLKNVRLNAASRMLRAAHPLQDSVASIALGQGFTHLGRFSVEFGKRFGKSPRDTLAMRAGQKS
jgi:AraC-like DNA-binding protein